MDVQEHHHDGPDGGQPRLKGLWLGSLVLFAALYLPTCQRGASWQDSGKRQWRVRVGDYRGDLGLALAHPLYIAAGQALRSLPIATLETRLNAFSGLGMAVALANLACVGAVLARRRWIGLAVAGMLAVAHTVWWLATIAEVYTWSVAGLTCELWLLVSLLRRPRARTLAALALVSGLGWSLHNFALLPLPVYAAAAVALVVRRRLPRWSLGVAAGAYLLGAGLFLAMIVDEAARTGSVSGAVGSALFGRYARQVLSLSVGHRYLRENLGLMGMNFVNVLAPLAVIGWARMRRVAGGAVAAALLAVTVIEALFVLRYPVPDQFMFLLPTLMLVGVAAAVGLRVLADASRRWRVAAVACCIASIVVPPAFYAAAPSLAREAGVSVRRTDRPALRDELRYWLLPWKHDEDSAERFAHVALDQAGPDGILVADGTSVGPLRLVQRREGRWAGVAITRGLELLQLYESDRGAFDRRLGGRSLLLVSPMAANVPPALRDHTAGPRKGEVLYRFVP